MLPDSYRTVASATRCEIPNVRGSRFLADVKPVDTPEEALAFVDELRKREYAATHHCFAYRLSPDGSVHRSSDDGEPAGSAGRPILQVIEGRNLTNVVLVVTRYFGGTRLGIGGLVRAYGGAASAVLDQVETVESIRLAAVVLTFEIVQTSAIMRSLDRFDVQIRDRRYAERTELDVVLAASDRHALVDQLREATGGMVEVRMEDRGEVFGEI